MIPGSWPLFHRHFFCFVQELLDLESWWLEHVGVIVMATIFMNFDLKERDLFHDWTIIVLKLDISLDPQTQQILARTSGPRGSWHHDGFEDLYFVRPLVEACAKLGFVTFV